jgi:cytochrome c oxidase subunit II
MMMTVPALLAQHEGTYWFPPAGSTFAEETDTFFMYLLYIATFFFVLVVGAMVIFAIKYRRRPGYEGDSTALHNNLLEITWTVIPTLIVCWIFARGVQGYMDMMTPPADTIDISVTARKWSWSFTYPNGAESPELHVPINKAVRLLMRSDDVLHSFYVPAFRAKADVVPGRVTTMWFEPILIGEFKLVCTEYCGDDHSRMFAKVEVHSQADYEKKLVELNKSPEAPVAHGEWLYERRGCKACHSIEKDKIQIGPSFAGSWGTEFKDVAGNNVKFDEQYVLESIESPQAKMKPDFKSATLMPSYKGRFNPKEVNAITAFMKALADGVISADERDALPPPTPTADPPTTPTN